LHSEERLRLDLSFGRPYGLAIRTACPEKRNTVRLVRATDEVGLGLMRHANTEFEYLSRLLPSLYIADRREDEPVELPW
jgi:hypothetical protein